MTIMVNRLSSCVRLPRRLFFGAIAASQDYLSHTDFKNRSIQSVKNAVEMSLKSTTCEKNSVAESLQNGILTVGKSVFLTVVVTNNNKEHEEPCQVALGVRDSLLDRGISVVRMGRHV